MNTSNKDNFIFHYTTIGAICSMLNTYRENGQNKNLVFWASSIFTMNDPKEMLHGQYVLNKILPTMEQFYNIEEYERLDINEVNMGELMKRTDSMPFVFCLSNSKDDLHMWHMYGDKGNGVSLVFHKEVKSFFNGKETEMIEVNYNNGIDNFEILSKIYNEGLEKQRNCQIKDNIRKIKEDAIIKLFIKLCPYIKSEAYKLEQEYRFIFSDVPVYEIQFREKNSNIIPYVNVQIPIDYLEKIVVGPCCDKELTSMNLRLLLDCCGLQRVKIEESKIPYRNL